MILRFRVAYRHRVVRHPVGLRLVGLRLVYRDLDGEGKTGVWGKSDIWDIGDTAVDKPEPV